MKHTRAVLTVAAIVLGATVTLLLQDGPQGCCAHAQTPSPETKTNTQPTPTPSTAPSTWDHNGSVMYLVENGASREFHYQTPRPGMVEVGARSGSLLFRGRVDNGQYSGTAYIFNPHCGPLPFQVTGEALDNDDRIVLTGQAPQVGRNCRTTGSVTSTLEFKRSNPTAAASSPTAVTPSQQELVGATPPPGVEQSNPQTPSAIEAASSSSQVTGPNVTGPNVTAPNVTAPKVTASKVTANTPTAQAPATTAAPAATTGADNFIWAALIVAVILVIGAAAMLAAS